MLWFNFILCFKLIIIHYHTPKQRKIKYKPRIKLNLTYTWSNQNLNSLHDPSTKRITTHFKTLFAKNDGRITLTYRIWLAFPCYEKENYFVRLTENKPRRRPAAVKILASRAGVFRGARFSSLPTNACSTKNNIPFSSLANHIVLSKFWKVDLDRKVI